VEVNNAFLIREGYSATDPKDAIYHEFPSYEL